MHKQSCAFSSSKILACNDAKFAQIKYWICMLESAFVNSGQKSLILHRYIISDVNLCITRFRIVKLNIINIFATRLYSNE